MGYIYRIYHIESGKSYIGQTSLSVEERYKQHIYNAQLKTSRAYNQHLKRAIRKYGEDSFAVEEIEQCDNSLLDEREKYWIEHYDSVRHGYNMTYGGEGKVEHDSKEMVDKWNSGMNITEICKELGLCWKCVSKHLKASGITDEEIKKRRYDTAIRDKMKPVYQYSLDGVLIAEYPSVADAKRKCGCKTIYNAVGKHKKSHGYYWSYEKAV